MSKHVTAEIFSVSRTHRSVDGTDILEVRLLIPTAEKTAQTFTGEVYPQKVELKTDPADANLHPDDLKDLMAQAASDWDQQFSDWDAEILSRDEPVEVGN